MSEMKDTLFGILLGGLVTAGLAFGAKKRAVLMGHDEANMRATEAARHIMDCFGGGGGYWDCRPAGISQTEHPEIFVHPVVVCEGHACKVVAP